MKICRYVEQRFFEIIVLLFGIIIRIIYLSQTSFNIRSHDAIGHLEYIQYIAKNGTLPIYNQGWEFYHPPLYYVVGALIYKLSLLLGVDYTISLQLLSLGFFIGMLICFYYIIQMFIKSPFLRLLTFSLVVFWPSGIIHSIRIGNDTLQYFTTSISFLFLLKWVKSGNNNTIYISLILFIISMLTKSNAIILLPLYFVAYYQKLSSMKLGLRQVLKNLFVPFIVIIISLFILFYNNIFHQQKNYFVANITNLNGALMVEKEPINFLFFDWPKFINNSYISPWDDAKGRQYFWNYLLKTSMFGEFEFNGKVQLMLSQILSFTIIALLIYIIIGVVFQRKKQLKKQVFIILFLVSQLIFIILGRIFLPYSSTNDFRYIFPSIVSLAILFSTALILFKEKKLILLEYAGYLILCLFIISSVAFFLFPL